MKTLLIYDLEASGLSPLDQVLSYAAIRTNLDLEILDKTEIEVSWRRDMIPSSEAYLVHQIPISGRESISEGEAIQKIHEALNQPNTLSGGYNTLGFDDELLRFSFYRCLLTPYTHQYQNGCGRFDVLPMVVFYYLYAPDVLKWPMIDGKPTFKLEFLNQENGWVEGRSHEAMVDVEVTLALMKTLRSRQDMWDYLLGFYDKAIDQKRTHQALDQNVGIMVSLMWGYDRGYQVPVYCLGQHNQYKNQLLFMRLDEPLFEKSESELLNLSVRKKWGEPGFILPYRSPYQDRFKPEVLSIVKENVAFLKEKGESLRSLCSADRYEPVEGLDTDVDLYQKGFLSQAESSWCEQFHKVYEKSLESCPSSDLKEKALRYLWRNHPDKLPEGLQAEAEKSILQYLSASVDHRNREGMRIDRALDQVKYALETTEDPGLRTGLLEIKDQILAIQSMMESITQHTE